MKNLFKVLLAVAFVSVFAMAVSAATVTFDLLPLTDTTEEENMWELWTTVNMGLENGEEGEVSVVASYFYFNPEKLVLCDLDYEPIDDYATATDAPVYMYNYGTNRKPIQYECVFPTDDSKWWVPQEDGRVRGYITVTTGNYVYDVNDLILYSLAFKLADGVTKEDLVYSDFEIQQVFIQENNLGTYGYKYEQATDNELEVINNVVPEAEEITISVAAGDIVYLQDGTTVVMADANEAYEILSTVGYVAVNKGMESQKTYYVDGLTATEVHTNGVVGSESTTLRGPDELYDHDNNPATPEVERTGIRFKMTHNPGSRNVEGHKVTEVGFIMTVESALVIGGNSKGKDYVLDMNMVSEGYALKGVAFGVDENGKNRDMATDTTLDDEWIINGVMYNIPLRADTVKVPVASRPYYKVGDAYIYGEITKTSLFDVAKEINNDADRWNGCSAELQEYITSVLVVGGETEIIEDEIVIDISGLYENN